MNLYSLKMLISCNLSFFNLFKVEMKRMTNNRAIWKQEIIADIKIFEQYKFISKQSILHKTHFCQIIY